MKVAYKVWLDSHGQAFGEGPHELLIRTKKAGSLYQAAHQMGMSYTKAWRLLHTMEKRLGFLLLDRKVGGHGGGGSQVTAAGEELIIMYARFQEDVKKTLEKIYQENFGSMLKKGKLNKWAGRIQK